MDFKVKFVAILLSLLTILAVVTSVAGYNLYQHAQKLKKEAAQAEEVVLQEDDENSQGIKGDYSTNVGLIPENPQNDYSAFERDETFFDEEQSKYEELLEYREKKLSMAATSIDKDLRVRIYNNAGNLIQGKELYIRVDDTDYKDLDQDGIIYVPDLKAGIHEVYLMPFEDYQVPKSPMQVSVKANIEYVPIDDISVLIRTEAEINPEEEDTEDFDDENEDSSQMTGTWSSKGNESFGIDVSKWNKYIDWVKVRNAGVTFAIIRCGYRGSKTGALVEDPYFRENLINAKAAGVEVGLYFFTQAVNEVEAVEEASMVLALNNGLLDYPIFIDTEGAGGNGRADYIDALTRTAVCKAFCETIENAGYDAGIYASRSWYNSQLIMDDLEKYCIWLAEYRDEPLYTRKYNMWQYTSKGELDGIQGVVDFDISYPMLSKESDSSIE